MKVSVIYHSESGNTASIADAISKGASLGGTVESKSMHIDKIDQNFIEESSAVIIGCPTYGGTYSWQIKKWLDTAKINLRGKLGSAFATENHIGGGADIAELGILGHLLVKGMLVYTAGNVKEENVMLHYGAVAIRSGDEYQQKRASALGKAVAEKAKELFS
jgi:NAD(P)H dehydrogenase (quinone)